MEILNELVKNQLHYVVPVGIAVASFILVFLFGFRTAEQPPYAKLISDDRKQLNKKRKIKEKKPTANGHIATGETKLEKSPSKESKRSPLKEINAVANKDKKNDAKPTDKKKSDQKSNDEKPEIKSKKSLKKVNIEKPADFDDGDWETVPLKNEKKKKEKESPSKKDKKTKKEDKVDEINRDLTEYEQEVKAKIENAKSVEKKEEPVPVIEEKKEKKKEKKAKIEDKPTSKPVEEVVAAPQPKKSQPKPKPVPKEEPKEEVAVKEEKAEIKDETPVGHPSGGVAFDELGDVWTEAKAVKKAKKKSRREN